ncbi:MAG TPA: hypothetical protein P5081_18290 [Phycisphaerae bacterium]|nr:hypothetical protein [Phycisphaerae bacterium]HRW54822.1 hypothetical protein [Phycisphaerae bacterium]
MIFTGHYEHTIDSKNRLAIPRKYRSRLDPERDGAGFVITPGRPSTTLWMYTERAFEELASHAKSTLIPDEDQLYFDKVFFPLAEYLDLDAQGRVLLPDKMLERAGLGKEVMVCGVRDHIEIRPRGEFEEDMEAALKQFSEFQVRARDAYRGN